MIFDWLKRKLSRRPEPQPEPAPEPELEDMPEEPGDSPELDDLGEPEELTLEELGIEAADLPPLEFPDPPAFGERAEYTPTQPEIAGLTAEEVRDELHAYMKRPVLLPDDTASTGGFRAALGVPVATGLQTPNGTNCKWSYVAHRVRMVAANGDANDWQEYGDEFALRNRYEAKNTTLSICLGLPTSALDYDSDGTDEFYPLPIPEGTIVDVKVDMLNGEPQYSFSEPNTIAGGC